MRFWLFRKFIFQKKIFLEPTTLFSLFGISLGVAFLIVSMAGFSGFTSTLKKSIIDVSGDIVVFKRGGRVKNPDELAQQIKENSSRITELLPYVHLEALVANKGKLSAVLLQGIDLEQAEKVLKLKSRTLSVAAKDIDVIGKPAHLGKVVAKNLKLKAGDSFKAILPRVSKTSATEVTPKLETFYVQSIIDFGKYEFNERVVISDKSAVQKLADMGNRINGFRIKIDNSDLAEVEATKIQEALGWDFSVKDWSKTNKSLFKAIRYEKMVLFFVMLIMVVAAFFNVSTTLFLGVLRRYSQVSVMRALGLKRRDIVMLFCFHGLVLGSVGLIIGIVLGFLFCIGFEEIQKIYPIMPEEVYRLSNFSTEIYFQDLVWVVVATLVICFLSTLAPAFRGASLSPVEGLKYE